MYTIVNLHINYFILKILFFNFQKIFIKHFQNYTNLFFQKIKKIFYFIFQKLFYFQKIFIKYFQKTHKKTPKIKEIKHKTQKIAHFEHFLIIFHKISTRYLCKKK